MKKVFFYYLFVFLCFAEKPNLKLPFIAGESWWIMAGSEYHVVGGKDEYALDFNFGAGYEDFGKPILAAANGTIIFSGWQDGYGWVVDIDHGDNYVTRYTHLSLRNVSVNDYVVQGEQIGRCGDSGPSNCHLHFALYRIVDGVYTAVEAEPMSGYENVYPGGNTVKYVSNNDIVGYYSDGFHNDGTGAAFLCAFYVYKPKIGWPTNNGPFGVYVHEWQGQTNSSYSVIAQDFLGNVNWDHYGTNGRSVLILDDVSYLSRKEAYLLSGGFYGHYCENDGPYTYGVPITNEITDANYANGHLVSTSDFIQPSASYLNPKKITVQKFQRRQSLGNIGIAVIDGRRTLVYDPVTENIQRFPVGEFSIDGALVSGFPDKVQWYIMVGSNENDDIAWPMLGVKSPTGKWFTKAGVYNFILHDENGHRINGSASTLTHEVLEGNYQFAGTMAEDNSLIPPENVKATAYSEQQVNLNWNSVPGAERYYVYRNTSNYPGGAQEIT